MDATHNGRMEMTRAQEIVSMNDYALGFHFASDGEVIDQDWESETTTFEFEDGSRVVVDGRNEEIRVID